MHTTDYFDTVTKLFEASREVGENQRNNRTNDETMEKIASIISTVDIQEMPLENLHEFSATLSSISQRMSSFDKDNAAKLGAIKDKFVAEDEARSIFYDFPGNLNFWLSAGSYEYAARILFIMRDTTRLPLDDIEDTYDRCAEHAAEHDVDFSAICNLDDLLAGKQEA